MPDKLTDLYNAWLENNPDGNTFQAFQAGLTAGAVAMRSRALKIVDRVVISNNVKNALKNDIGQLSDIPTE